ncbi:TetR/AcrR family transcriptional regulator [Morganella morganii]|uniref:TetR/AcrR family transcriptional regulator n=1 Tax=Morganella morganii TaxID=582 RepID=UPI001BDB15FF|nr:TetR/AcrR family transcriptional regulator [Morganella morganii]MBT0395843.1 TetR/AcrR family transcriptional regulator [Morganella morganii subsp. morganii]MBT0461305.1 TetR/AcrR family transcriptional regulator [Morganella morganii subsp. morganii]
MKDTDTTQTRLSARDRLLEAAGILFYNEGIAATGIDTITKKAGVAKKSLYNNFSSKAELVTTYIRLRHEEWLALYDVRLQQATTPAQRILAVFDAYHDHAEFAYERGFRGCGLLNAAAEFPAGSEERREVCTHKSEVADIIRKNLYQLLPEDTAKAEQLTAHLAFLLEGAIVLAGLEEHGARVLQAAAMAKTMLEAL